MADLAKWSTSTRPDALKETPDDTDDRWDMGRHLLLALVALVAGCVDLTSPTVIPEDAAPTEDGHSDGLPAADGLRDAVGPGPDGPRPAADRLDLDTAPPDPTDGHPPPPLLANGATCVAGSVCQSGICSEGVCCDQDCSQRCRSCKIPGSLGACIATPLGQDPRSECGAEVASTCGRAGGCDGGGACRLHSSGTVCANASCAGTTETPARTCDGQGVCQSATPRSCAPYLCASPTSCATSCTTTSQCAGGGQVCFLNTCVPTGTPPALYWNFDESSGSTALDGSGNGIHGLYTGVSGSPQPSVNVPTLMFPNPRSRAFSLASRHAVHLSNTPGVLQPSNNITVSVWYRATQVDTQNVNDGSELVTAGDNYMLRLETSAVVLVKRTASNGFPRCDGRRAGFAPLDGQWHHVAGVASTSGLRVYLDGEEGCFNSSVESISYGGTDQLYVGRHGIADTDRDFDGQIDEVRIYTRALSVTEIRALAAGGR